MSVSRTQDLFINPTLMTIDCTKIDNKNCNLFINILSTNLIRYSDQPLSVKSHVVPNGFIQTINDYCTDLRELNCTSSNLTDQNLLDLFKRNLNLDSLILDDCEQISGLFIDDNTQPRNAIKTLSLANCSNLIPTSLLQLGTQFPNLTKLNLNSAKLTDFILINILNGCRHLTTLFLENCPFISGVGIHYLSVYSSVTTLSVRQCKLNLSEIQTYFSNASLEGHFLIQKGEEVTLSNSPKTSLRRLSVLGEIFDPSLMKFHYTSRPQLPPLPSPLQVPQGQVQNQLREPELQSDFRMPPIRLPELPHSQLQNGAKRNMPSASAPPSKRVYRGTE